MMNWRAFAAVWTVPVVGSVPTNVWPFRTHPTVGDPLRIPRVTLVSVLGTFEASTVWLATVRRTEATSPGSTIPSGTLLQTPLPGKPGVSHAEFERVGHCSIASGSSFGFGSPEVQTGSAV